VPEPSFTVLIPTRERADTLRHAIRTVAAQDYERLTLVVSDNASTDDTREVVESARDPRIRYVNSGRRLSMTENFELALSHADGDWICLMGDDDGLLPGAIRRAAEIIGATGCTAMSSRFCSYAWPGFKEDGEPPFLSVPTGTGFELREPRRWLRRVLQGLASYTELPMLYTGGFLSAAVVARGRRGGIYFRSRTPDVYSAVLSARLLDSYVAVREPLAVNGASRHSHGSSVIGLSGNQGPAAQFASEGGVEFHPFVGPGKLSSIPMLVYEALLQSEALCAGDGIEADPLEQLGLALRVATSANRERILGIAERNGFTGDVVEAASRQRPAHDPTWYRATLRTWLTDRVIPGAHGAQNVHEAALVARAVHTEAQEGAVVRGGRTLVEQVRARLAGRFGRG
jgi:hypothetical protein